MAPNLARDGDTVLLTWLEPVRPGQAPGSGPYRLRFSRLGAAGWSATRTIVEGDDLFANWADFPSVTAAREGWLLAHWAARSGPDTYAYDVALARSDDGGATWTRRGTANDDGTQTEHGFVAMVPEGDAVRAFWLDGRAMKGESGEMSVRTARVGGAPGRGEILDARVCECCQTDAAVTSKGPIVVYRDRSGEEVRDIAIVRRVAGRWMKPAPVHADGWKIEGCPVNGPAVAAAGDRLAVAWYTAADERPRVRVAFSRDAGASFDPPVDVDAGSPLGRVDVLLDARGALVLWVASDGKNAAVRLRRVTTDGRLGEPLTVSPTTTARSSGFPRIETRGDELVIVWVEVESAETTRLRSVTLPRASLPDAKYAAAGQ